MKVNLHTHTTRCGHATGTEREYIERAIEGGLDVLGFSDHAPHLFPDGYESRYRVPCALAKEYVETISALREEYKDKIDIRIGFEMEYYPLYFKDMLNRARDAGAEYLILGQHYIGNERLNKRHMSISNITEDELRTFVDEVCAAIKTGVFTYVAHPDVVNYMADEEIYLKEMRRICETAKEYNVPLEINFLGIRSNRHYPNQSFWKMVGEVGAPVVYGCDAHSPAPVFDGESLKVAEKMREKYGLKVIEKPSIVNIQNIEI